MLQRKQFSWAKKISAYVNEGQCQKGLTLIHYLQKSGAEITEFHLSAVLKACGRLQAIDEGKVAHAMILKRGYHGDVVLMTSLVDMYSKCSTIDSARRVYYDTPKRDVIATNAMITGLCLCGQTTEAIQLFDGMPSRVVGSWNSLISGLARNSHGGEAMQFFKKMRSVGEKEDFTTLVSVLSVCADLAQLINGRQVHGLVIKHGFEFYVPVGNALVDVYAKSGCMDDACRCFDNMPSKNIVSWTTLIMGYGKHGLGSEALRAFDQMKLMGFVPNKITLLGTLYACTHAGLMQEGWDIFNSMVHTYSITPMMEHYTCMVDLLSRAGRLEETCWFIERMPVEPDVRLWTAFLSSCCFHKNVDLARSVGEKLMELRPQESGPYVLLSNFYGLIGDWEGVAQVRRLMLDRGVRKEKACTWIEINGVVHAFESGDRSHPSYKEIYNYLEDLIKRMKSIGYVAKTGLVVQNVEEHVKEEILLGHSEKLAIGLGLISTPPGTKIVIIKNLRVCMDCHDATRFISEIEGREIVARDASRFHQFKGGECSCGNHW
ncbi:pentatricopeptide repeat-containing protein At1g25360-like [Magnolia sinica]|uniref:pentatricopeptide repeat-containing protein At1g25360-like n=1 Tax=Magnolia sinica TaxID=86752 RepID=UPI0026589BCE|nr:pentatricopeptide repeat-containing protein At1g25360-like [Magnolia sinica]